MVGSKRKEKNDTSKFVDCCARLTPVEFYGLSIVLRVNIMKDEDELRDFHVILSEMINAFAKLSKKKRKEIMKTLKETTKGRGYFKGEEVEEDGSEN